MPLKSILLKCGFDRLIPLGIALTIVVSTVHGSDKDTLIIAMYGDSLIQGYGLSKDDGFVSQMQAKFTEANFNVRLRNLGVSGDTTSSGLARFEWSMAEDISAMVLLLGANDMLRGLPPELSYENLVQILTLAKKKNLPTFLIGINAINNYGLDYKSKFDKIFIKLKEEFDIDYYPNFFQALQRDKSVDEFLIYMQADKIHPNAVGIEKITSDLAPEIFAFVESLE